MNDINTIKMISNIPDESLHIKRVRYKNIDIDGVNYAMLSSKHRD